MDNNITMESVEKENTPLPVPPEQQEVQQQQQQLNITSIEVQNENVALNLMVSFLQLGHKRGAYSLEESAKIWECIKMFVKPQ